MHGRAWRLRHWLHRQPQEQPGNEVLARRIVKLVEKKKPPLRNVVANLEQWLSTVIKRVLTGNQMVAILRDYYKS